MWATPPLPILPPSLASSCVCVRARSVEFRPDVIKCWDSIAGVSALLYCIPELGGREGVGGRWGSLSQPLSSLTVENVCQLSANQDADSSACSVSLRWTNTFILSVCVSSFLSFVCNFCEKLIVDWLNASFSVLFYFCLSFRCFSYFMPKKKINEIPLKSHICYHYYFDKYFFVNSIIHL